MADGNEKHDKAPQQIVYTNKAQCRDCYRCLRNCPVKAIRMHDGQAQVISELCIECGTCIRQCPQGAKTYRRDIDLACGFSAEDIPMAASVAPSFVAMFDEWQRKRLPSALRMLGFAYVGETAIGADMVSRETARIVAEKPDQPWICSACPAVVSYIERYQPDMVRYLVPVASPMIAHARHIKEKFAGDVRVVFIGPCIAKKGEATRYEDETLVDCAITFQELLDWFERAGVNLSACEESDFDELSGGAARMYPLEGGLIRTACMSTDMLNADTVAVSGFDELVAVLDNIRNDPQPMLVEPLFCPDGCVNGPAMPGGENMFRSRKRVLTYADDTPALVEPVKNLGAAFKADAVVAGQEFSEERIREVLRMTGKESENDELNCGACGYPSCREKAVAVLRGLAEPEMCIPYMRRLAERRTDRILETSPNGIMMVDAGLRIISMNNAFKKFFMCSDAVLGRHVSYLMDPHLFEQLAAGRETQIETLVRHDRYNLLCHEILYTLPEDKQYVGIFVNITRSQSDRDRLDHLRAETTLKARELLDHQRAMAESIVKFLGQSTADGEKLLDNLMLLAGDDERKIFNDNNRK